MNMKKYHVYVVISCIAAVIFAAVFLGGRGNEPIKTEYIEFIKMLESGTVKSVSISEGPTMSFTLIEDEMIYETPNPRIENLKEILLLAGAEVTEKGYTSSETILSNVVGIGFFALAGFFAFRMINKRSARGMMSLELNANAAPGYTFESVAGNDEAKDSVSDIIEFIKNPGKYAGFGARMPRGIVFYGAPGTGKTLMAKAIAGEAGVPFYAVSGSDFVQMYVGVGAGRIRELFKKARESGKAVIFIDEIDALGKKRSSQAVGGNDERDQTLNALLTEMSGFHSGDGIVVIAATNRLDILDEALLRPGRFDRLVEISLPDIKSRARILELYAKGKPLANNINLERLAKQCVFFSGAMLENLLNEAAIIAANDDNNENSEIMAAHIDKAYYTIIAGSEKKDRSGIRDEERRITAYHESGHALVTKLRAPLNSVSRISIVPVTGGAGGFCVNIPQDKMYYTKKELLARIMICLAGRASEELVFGADSITTGASNDIEKANALIGDFVYKYGMSDALGITAARAGEMAMAEESRRLLGLLYAETKELLAENMEFLDKISAELLEKETLDEEELDRLLA